MSDATCPYCGYEQEINHDDGCVYDEDVLHEQECVECDKTFNYRTMVIIMHKVECQEGDHEMTHVLPGMYRCKNCDYVEWRR